MQNYLDLLDDVLRHGTSSDDRTGVGTVGQAGGHLRFKLHNVHMHPILPLVTTKKMSLKVLIHELIWFLRGDTNIKYLVDNNVHIWDDWPYKAYMEQNRHSDMTQKEFIEKIKEQKEFAYKWGDIGPGYGKQWRRWEYLEYLGSGGYDAETQVVDQLGDTVERLKSDPGSRRHVVSAWNPAEVPDCLLPPCHCLYQFVVYGNKLSLILTQRSCDLFLGAGYNFASYSLLCHIVAKQVGLIPYEFIWNGGDVHIYRSHFDAVREQLKRTPNPSPKIKIKDGATIDNLKYEDIEIIDYKHHPAIKAPVAV
jgi:thymidylate synthase